MTEPSAPGQPEAKTQVARAHDSGLPPLEIMNRMMDLQERRLELDGRQIALNEREIDNNRELASKSMDYSREAEAERKKMVLKVTGWRYLFWGLIILIVGVAVSVALFMGKEDFVIEVLKYLGGFLTGYGVKAASAAKKKSSPPPDDEG